jgi:hypothetical protein
MNTDPHRGWTGHELATAFGRPPHKLLTQLAEWTHHGYLTRVATGAYALNTSPGSTARRWSIFQRDHQRLIAAAGRGRIASGLGCRLSSPSHARPPSRIIVTGRARAAAATSGSTLVSRETPPADLSPLVVAFELCCTARSRRQTRRCSVRALGHELNCPAGAAAAGPGRAAHLLVLRWTWGHCSPRRQGTPSCRSSRLRLRSVSSAATGAAPWRVTVRSMASARLWDRCHRSAAGSAFGARFRQMISTSGCSRCHAARDAAVRSCCTSTGRGTRRRSTRFRGVPAVQREVVDSEHPRAWRLRVWQGADHAQQVIRLTAVTRRMVSRELGGAPSANGTVRSTRSRTEVRIETSDSRCTDRQCTRPESVQPRAGCWPRALGGPKDE